MTDQNWLKEAKTAAFSGRFEEAQVYALVAIADALDQLVGDETPLDAVRYLSDLAACVSDSGQFRVVDSR